ncbi:MAG: glucose-6-phosphate isomerase [Chloroflexi bacterium]|nr:glucose-6-phosphate isomerase [Chloroflexota bacterium]
MGIASHPAVARNDITRALADADKNKTVERIWQRDPFLWKKEQREHKELADRLGWLTVAQEMQKQIADLLTFADEIKRAGFKDVVLCGIGGSALCVEVLRVTLGTARGLPQMHVFDTIDPASIRALERKTDLKKTLFIIASKSGGTTETLTQFKYFRSHAADGKQFIAITDAGSVLDQLARENNFRRIFHNPPDIGGRFSALSYFGLVPAALMGIDLARLLARAEEMRGRCENPRAEENPGAWLGVAFAELARQGRDKITLVASPGIDMFGVWAEQLIAESTGKEGKGLVPIDREPVAAPAAYGDDRVFVFVEMEKARNQEIEKRLRDLEIAGHPVIRLQLRDAYDIGAEFFRWEFAIAVAGARMQINPFNQPNVQESKDNTKRVLGLRSQVPSLKSQVPSQKPILENKQFAVYSTEQIATKTLRDALRAFFAQARAGDYLALMAYLSETESNQRALQLMRIAARGALKIATTLGYAPHFLHSTGQLHKGGPNSILALQITADARGDVKIPGEPYSFAELQRAQSLGDWESLKNHGRRALRVHLKRGATMAQLLKEFQMARRKPKTTNEKAKA